MVYLSFDMPLDSMLYKAQTKQASGDSGEEQTSPIDKSEGKNLERNQAQLDTTISPLAKLSVQSCNLDALGWRTLDVHCGEAAGVSHRRVFRLAHGINAETRLSLGFFRNLMSQCSPFLHDHHSICSGYNLVQDYGYLGIIYSQFLDHI